MPNRPPDTVFLHLTVSQPGRWVLDDSTAQRYVKVWRTNHLPNPGDSTVICWPAGDSEDGVMWPVAYRWWDGDGHPHLRLTDMAVNPPPEDEHMITAASYHSPTRLMAWRSVVENGQLPYQHLASAGWHLEVE